MSGASESDESVHTGRVNRGEGRTVLWADVPPGESNFDGPAILIVEVAKDAEDPDDFEDGESFIPSNQFNGIMATGWSGGSASEFGGTPGGTGVVGRGGRNQGTGIVGLGGGTPEPDNGGAGGIGVHGFGGPQADFFADPATPPGAGLVGQGGRQSTNGNTLRLPHAAGVIGIAGGAGRNFDALPTHTLMETGGVGVYGQGGAADVAMVPPIDADGNSTSGPDVPSGPTNAGPGVLGRGGESSSPDALAGAGVIGLAGGTAIPSIFQTTGIGVFGAGMIGVFGQGEEGRGGIFTSEKAAQVQLTPRKAGLTFLMQTAAPPIIVAAERQQVRLPKDGRPGDILTLIDDQGQCVPFFCVSRAGGGPAKWAEILLGPSVAGI